MRTQRHIVLALAAFPVVVTAQRPQPPAPARPAGTVVQPTRPTDVRERIVTQRTAGQPDRGPGRQGGVIRQPSITGLLNLRRQLELTPRQVIQFDSIERVLFTERRTLVERRQGERQAQDAQARPIAPDSQRARQQRLQSAIAAWRLRDSSALASAERALTEAQRQKLREIRAYERGRADAMRQFGGSRLPQTGRPRSDREEVEVEVRRTGPEGEEVRVERRMTRPPA